MVVLRNGKKCGDGANKKSVQKRKNVKFAVHVCRDITIKLNRLSKSEIELHTKPKAVNKYNLRLRTEKPHTEHKTSVRGSTSNKIVAVSTANVIWNELVSCNEKKAIYPSEIVLARMNTFRPWPARVNSIYKLGNVTKCYVLFFGTMQIGSVLKSQCVKLSECDQFLFHTVREIKAKFRWNLDYESLSKTDDIERAVSIQKLTQVQKLFLALRDIERLRCVPYSISMVRSQVEH